MRSPDSTLEEGQINPKNIIAWGLLTCVGTPNQKCQVLFNLLQENGGNQLKSISANDKDYKVHFRMLVLLSTVNLFEFAEEH